MYRANARSLAGFGNLLARERGTIRWHKEELGQVWIGRHQQLNESAKTEVDNILPLLGELRSAVQKAAGMA